MVEHLDQETKLERRTLRKANELFLQRLQREAIKQLRAHAADNYNANDDFARSIELAYEVIRTRMAAGGKGWTPP